MNIGIIGTAGRKEDGKQINKDLFFKMCRTVQNIIYPFSLKEETITYVSGGAAVADHIAVVLFLSNLSPSALKLYFPCEFDKESCQFVETFAKFDVGSTSNHYHRKFSKIVGKNTLEQLKKAIDLNAFVGIGNGFKSRNTMVSNESDVLIALTFGNGAKLKDGGTLDTMTKFIKKKGNKYTFHVDLNDLKVYTPAKI